MTKTLAATMAAFLLAIAAIVVAFFWFTSPSFAADTEVSFAPLVNTLLEYLVPALGVLIAALIGWAAALIKKRTGLEIEARHREALHSAAMTGVRIALEKFAVSPSNLTADLRSKVLADGVEWIQESVPDALKHFGLTPDRLSVIVASKLAAIAPAP